jgi:parallel beta-helix repeat protein
MKKALFFAVSPILIFAHTVNGLRINPVNMVVKVKPVNKNTIYSRLQSTGNFNVKEYGAVGNGIHDDSNAIDSCSIAAGKNATIYFPAGTYLTKYIYSNHTGQKFIGSNAIIKLTGMHYGFIIRHDGVTVSGFSILGTGAVINSFLGTQIILQGASHCIITHNKLSKLSSTGIYLSEGMNSTRGVNSACSYNIIDHNEVLGAQGDHGWGILLGYSNHLLHAYNQITNNFVDGQMKGITGILLQGNGCHIKIAGNSVKKFTMYGIICYAKNNSPLPDVYIYDALITNNYIDSIGVLSGTTYYGSGIYMAEVDRVIISGNTIKNANIGTTYGGIPMGGISINGSHGFTITGNLVDSSAYAGINIANFYNGIISNNVVKRGGVKGMGFATGNNLIYMDNDIHSQGPAIHTDLSSTGIQIIGNKLFSNTSAGVYMLPKTSSDASIIDNSITAFTVGINLNGFKRYTISNNDLQIKRAYIGIISDHGNGQIQGNKILSSDRSSFTSMIRTTDNIPSVLNKNIVSKFLGNKGYLSTPIYHIVNNLNFVLKKYTDTHYKSIRHINSYIPMPTIIANAGAGQRPTIAVTGTDRGQHVVLTTGLSPATSSAIFTVTFYAAYNGAVKPKILVSSSNLASVTLGGPSAVYCSSVSNTSYTISVGAGRLRPDTIYTWDIIVDK